MKKAAPWLLLATLAFAGCPRACSPTPETGKPGIIDCTSQAVRDHAISLVPKVNSCLVSVLAGDVVGCLISLISPAAGIGEDVIGCLVRSAGSSYAASASVNPNDQVSIRAAENARKFIAERGYTFKN